MTLDEVLKYKGGRYSVLVTAASPDVYEETLLTKKYEFCKQAEIEMANETLARFVKGIAFSLVHETDDSDINKIKVV